MELYGAQQSIECDAAYVIAKKIVPSIPMNHPVLGKCLKFNCTRDGEATIEKELNPKVSRINNPTSGLNIGDKIIANAFYVLLKGFKSPKLSKTSFSGAHNANEFNTNDYTFAEISKAYPAGMNVVINLPQGYNSPFNMLTKKSEE